LERRDRSASHPPLSLFFPSFPLLLARAINIFPYRNGPRIVESISKFSVRSFPPPSPSSFPFFLLFASRSVARAGGCKAKKKNRGSPEDSLPPLPLFLFLLSGRRTPATKARIPSPYIRPESSPKERNSPPPPRQSPHSAIRNVPPSSG